MDAARHPMKLVGLLHAVLLAASPALPTAAQTPAQPAPGTQSGVPAPGTAGAAPTTPAPLEGYSYDAQGRRDPFVNLLNRGMDPGAASKRPDGPAGLPIGELALRGIVQTRGSFLAIVHGPDGKTYVLRSNDRLFDGSVKAVSADGILFLQDVNDPLSLVKQREVRKTLHATQEGR